METGDTRKETETCSLQNLPSISELGGEYMTKEHRYCAEWYRFGLSDSLEEIANFIRRKRDIGLVQGYEETMLLILAQEVKKNLVLKLNDTTKSFVDTDRNK